VTRPPGRLRDHQGRIPFAIPIGWGYSGRDDQAGAILHQHEAA
jgi:hypothetical protein